MATGFPAVVKWGKEKLRLGITLAGGGSGDSLKVEIFRVTGVPINRQKIFCKTGWKGALPDGAVFDAGLAPKGSKPELVLTLMGTADAPVVATEQAVFAEDLPPAAEEDMSHHAALDQEAVAAAEGMIIGLQSKPGKARDDGKAITYRYNYFVTGKPQRLIESILRRRREEGDHRLVGESAMKCGKELSKSYISALCVLENGTLVSGLESGRLQLWRHGSRLLEAHHEPAMPLAQPGPVNCIVALKSAGGHGFAFATGGNGSVKLWTADGECAHTIAAPMGTTPRAMVATAASGLAVTFGQARAFDPNAFRLVPQNEEQRRRRAEQQAQQQAQQAAYNQIATGVSVIELRTPPAEAPGGGGQRGGNVQSALLDGHGTAPVTALAIVGADSAELVVGDLGGGLRRWNRGSGVAEWSQTPGGIMQLSGAAAEGEGVVRLSVVDLEPTSQPGVLAVSTAALPGSNGGTVANDGGAAVLYAASPVVGMVLLIDVAARSVLAVLAGHTDVVQCMCALPDGGLATCGGKNDARVKVWHQEQWRPSADDGDAAMADTSAAAPSPPVLTVAGQDLKEPGYSFALAVLPDSKPGSRLFALASARYNTVDICL